ncbi:response regulator transcription factor [Enterococcus sp. LJL128]|uniref:response regulator transcription factor n=1 Tax=Enterococcus sp. LJL51 TaxID=3416656 RepID=UPI003CE674E5
MKKILLLEDDLNLNQGITLCLEKEGYEVFPCKTVRSAEQIFAAEEIDMILSDISLPDGNGLDFCRKIRQYSSVIIIMLTSYNQEYDIVLGYEQGADDYVTKPFSLMVLLSKVNTLMKRFSNDGAKILSSGDVRLHISEMKVFLESELTQLSKTEMQMLIYFMENPKQILTQEQLLEKIWDNKGDYVDSNTISVNISRLRQKIGKEKIKTVRGVGYIWIGDVQKF